MIAAVDLVRDLQLREYVEAIAIGLNWRMTERPEVFESLENAPSPAQIASTLRLALALLAFQDAVYHADNGQ